MSAGEGALRTHVRFCAGPWLQTVANGVTCAVILVATIAAVVRLIDWETSEGGRGGAIFAAVLLPICVAAFLFFLNQLQSALLIATHRRVVCAFWPLRRVTLADVTDVFVTTREGKHADVVARLTSGHDRTVVTISSDLLLSPARMHRKAVDFRHFIARAAANSR